jgi:hypothetical protein
MLIDGPSGQAQFGGVDPEQEAEQLAVARADALRAALPLGDHVGVDPDPFSAAQPGQADELSGHVLLGPTALFTQLAQERPPGVVVHRCPLPRPVLGEVESSRDSRPFG